MANLWTNYSTPALVLLKARAERAERIHHDGGRPYMASLCAERAAELAAEIGRRNGYVVTLAE